MSLTPDPSEETDVCLILEGSYPFVTGGVSSWTHDLIRAHRNLRFSIVAMTADGKARDFRYELPDNVRHLTVVPLQETVYGAPKGIQVDRFLDALSTPLRDLVSTGDIIGLTGVIDVLKRVPQMANKPVLLNSPKTFSLIREMYDEAAPGSSFLNYFWTWRALLGGLFSVLLGPLPKARIYHAISTGYAGLYLARAVIETGRPGLLTEHGIYTNERRQEIAMADWLRDSLPETFDLSNARRDLRDVWIGMFRIYSQVCYQACDRILTLYTGNQKLQLRDGAPADRLQIIPNGIDYDLYSSVARQPDQARPTVALIGRAVSIKDVKTYIRAAAKLRNAIPDVRCLLLGPTDEEPQYFAECEDLVRTLNLEDCFSFVGKVKLTEYLGFVDVVVLTSISEAQPLVLLEAGASGIPCVATDVGSCRDIIEGRADEEPALGPGGFVVPLANPEAVATAVGALLADADMRKTYGAALQARAKYHYNKVVVDAAYAELYDSYLNPRDRLAEAS